MSAIKYVGMSVRVCLCQGVAAGCTYLWDFFFANNAPKQEANAAPVALAKRSNHSPLRWGVAYSCSNSTRALMAVNARNEPTAMAKYAGLKDLAEGLFPVLWCRKNSIQKIPHEPKYIST